MNKTIVAIIFGVFAALIAGFVILQLIDTASRNQKSFPEPSAQESKPEPAPVITVEEPEPESEPEPVKPPVEEKIDVEFATNASIILATFPLLKKKASDHVDRLGDMGRAAQSMNYTRVRRLMDISIADLQDINQTLSDNDDRIRQLEGLVPKNATNPNYQKSINLCKQSNKATKSVADGLTQDFMSTIRQVADAGVVPSSYKYIDLYTLK